MKELSHTKWNFLYLLWTTKAELNIFCAAFLDLHVSYIKKYFLVYPLELHMASKSTKNDSVEDNVLVTKLLIIYHNLTATIPYQN